MPRLSVARPTARLPVPMASITLSPDPQETSVSGGQFGCGKTDRNRRADPAPDTGIAAGSREQPIVFLRRFGIIPQLDIAQHRSICIKHDQTMVLPRYGNRGHIARRMHGLRKQTAQHFPQSGNPPRGFLLPPAVRCLDDRVSGMSTGHDQTCFLIQKNRLGALRSTVDTEIHVPPLSERESLAVDHGLIRVSWRKMPRLDGHPIKR